MTIVETTSAIKRIAARPLPPCQTLAQKQGIRYENNIGKQLEKLARHMGGNVDHGVWFENKYPTGLLEHSCVDHVFQLGYCVVVIECKLTYTDNAISQLKRYVPLVSATVLRKLPRTQVKPLIICKSVTPECRTVPEIQRLSELFSKDYEQIPVLQWLGRVSITW